MVLIGGCPERVFPDTGLHRPPQPSDTINILRSGALTHSIASKEAPKAVQKLSWPRPRARGRKTGKTVKGIILKSKKLFFY